MNGMIHNTAWVQGHFHLTVGTATALSFMGAAYWFLPRLTGRELRLSSLAVVQPYLWFVGMMAFSLVNHATGLAGMPRRVYDASYGGHPAAEAWEAWTGISALGGVVLFVSAMFFVCVMFASLRGRKLETPLTIEYAETLRPRVPGRTFWDRFGLWTVIALIMIAIAYGFPILRLLQMERFGSPGFRPF
jgi:cytochrome c oxidase subunit 1